MRMVFMGKKGLSNVNKKILIGILSKNPEKHIAKISYLSKDKEGQDGAGTRTHNQITFHQRTPINFGDNDEYSSSSDEDNEGPKVGMDLEMGTGKPNQRRRKGKNS
jgi:hypothetical protein